MIHPRLFCIIRIKDDSVLPWRKHTDLVWKYQHLLCHLVTDCKTAKIDSIFPCIVNLDKFIRVFVENRVKHDFGQDDLGIQKGWATNKQENE